jgi:hypothetical protein
VFYTAGLQSPSWFFFENILYHPMHEYIQLGPWSPDTQLSALEYYYTSARLEGVREITPCHSWWEYSRELITGFLLKYFDGSRRSVGQVRLDFLGTQRQADTETLLIRFPKREDPGRITQWQTGIESFDFVDTIPEDEEEDHDLRVPIWGRLDWIICTYESRITHHRNAEPRDEMRHVLACEKNQGNARSNPVCRSLSKVFGETKVPTIHRGLNGHEINGSTRRLGLEGRWW